MHEDLSEKSARERELVTAIIERMPESDQEYCFLISSKPGDVARSMPTDRNAPALGTNAKVTFFNSQTQYKQYQNN